MLTVLVKLRQLVLVILSLPSVFWEKSSIITCWILENLDKFMGGVLSGFVIKDNGFKYPLTSRSTSMFICRLWNSVIVQGRGDYDDRMTKFKIQYTLDGK